MHRWLERKLKIFSEISIADEKRSAIKVSLMNEIRRRQGKEYAAETARIDLQALIKKIREYFHQVVPSRSFTALLREKIMVLAEYHPPRRFDIFFTGPFSRRVFAGVVAAVFLFAIAFQFTYRIDRVEASAVSVLESFSGDVMVLRRGEILTPVPGFLLKADDVIRTGTGSKAEIRFLDQSVSRLSENTEVKISKLFVNPGNKAQTVVELVLNQGRVWSKVINLIDNVSRFQIKAGNTIAVAKKKAAFDVSLQKKDTAKVAAQQHRVDVVVATPRKVTETTLVKGYSAEIKDGNVSLPPTITKETSEDADEWVKENLAEDEKYLETVKEEVNQEMREQAKTAPGSSLYAVLTFDEVEKKKKSLATVQEKMAQAHLLLEHGEKDKAAQLIQAFQGSLQEISGWAKSIEESSPEVAAEMRATIGEVLGVFEKKLAVVLPDDNLYALKSAVAETKVFVADTQLEKAEQKLSQAADKLLEVHDLLEKGDAQGAVKQLEEYKGAISEVSLNMAQLSGDDKEKVVSAMLENKVEDLKMLQAIEVTESKVIVGTGTVIGTTLEGTTTTLILGTSTLEQFMTLAGSTSPGVFTPQTSGTGTSQLLLEESALKTSVEELKKENLVQLGEAVLNVQQENPSVEVLQKIQEIKKNTDVNGKALVDMRLLKDKVYIQSEGKTFTVQPLASGSTSATLLPLPLTRPAGELKENSGTLESLPGQP